MAWFSPFHDPIQPPKGKPLVTLRDAATFIAALPKADQEAAPWQLAAEMLLMVAEHGGDTMMPRIAVMKALNHGNPSPASEPRRKVVKKHGIVR